ncbi:uncharacterized protein LOC112127735 [Cimex lectularius]|uniref:Gustatory receptor n=1 Tax=Cimex lectularius TaxID=79782 RepID=A0A8I6SNN8_CIMLE|nr:uncharacterized protein LOC112127735 [Cimex lectularius]
MLSFYYEVFRLCRKANDLYAQRLLFFLTHVFLEMTFNTYFVIKHFKTGKLDSFFASVFWIGYRILQVWHVVYVCTAPKRHAENFNTSLRFIFSFLDIRQKHITRLLSVHFIIKPEVEFTARGFFRIDFPLFLSMGAATASYLTFLVQSDN